ncbi:hypothetical protein ACFX2I_027249 [Malus domestica]
MRFRLLLLQKQLILWNGIDSAGGRRRSKHADSWLEDLVVLSLLLFKRLISAIKSGDLSLEMVETCLMHYAKKYIPGISRTNRKLLSSTSSLPSPSLPLSTPANYSSRTSSLPKLPWHSSMTSASPRLRPQAFLGREYEVALPPVL